MSDQQVREIQLGGKQLVFLFMASVVVAVAIFLLGVSVGRGVRSASAEANDTPTDVSVGGSVAPPLELPPATDTKPEDLQYHDQLQETTPPVAEIVPPEVKIPEPMAPAPAETAVAKPSTPSPPASTGWFLQANAFRSRENAERQAAQLRAKGYQAAVSGGPGGLYRVRIGPFADRADANRIADRLRKEEGITPSIQP